MLHLERCEALQERVIFFNVVTGNSVQGDRDENRAHLRVRSIGVRPAALGCQHGIGSAGASRRLAARLPDHSHLQLCTRRQLSRLPVVLLVPCVQVRPHGLLHRRHAQDLPAGEVRLGLMRWRFLGRPRLESRLLSA
jgi:hypothetical protein